MSGKLDQSLDDIVGARRKAGRGRRVKPAKKAGTPGAKAAPIGGVKKSSKVAKPVGKGAQGNAPHGPRDSKIVVSGLVRVPIIDISHAFTDVTKAIRCHRATD